jgi:hypothetical protein
MCSFPVAQHDAGTTIPGTVEQAFVACREVAADMGLIMVHPSPRLIVLREPWGFRWFLPVEVNISITDQEGGALVYAAGSSNGGPVGVQSQYVAKLVSSFAKRLADEVPSPPTQPDATRRRAGQRAVLKSLRVTGYMLWALLIPVPAALLVFLSRPWAIVPALGWLLVTMAVGLSCDHARRRLMLLGR